MPTMNTRTPRGKVSFSRSTNPAARSSAIAEVSRLMEDYSNRAVFRGLMHRSIRTGIVSFGMTWHGGLAFKLILNTRARTLTVPVVLPDVPSDSTLYHDFKTFVESHHDRNLPKHRRIDKAKAVVKTSKRGQNISLTMTVKDGDYAYGTQRLVHLIHETFVLFLANGIYLEYRIARLGFNPDWACVWKSDLRTNGISDEKSASIHPVILQLAPTAATGRNPRATRGKNGQRKRRRATAGSD